MALHLHAVEPAPPSTIVDIGGVRVRTPEMVEQLRRMTDAVARTSDVASARVMMLEAMAEVIAGWAHDNGKPLPARFAFELELDRAFMTETLVRASAGLGLL